MDQSPIKAALSKLLAHGAAATDAKLMRKHKSMASKGSTVEAEGEKCLDCGRMLVDGACEGCGHENPKSGANDLADLLEHGSEK